MTDVGRDIACGVCGSLVTLSARNVRWWESRGRKPTCRLCRSVGLVDPVLMADYRSWWLANYSLEELAAFAQALWPEDGAVARRPWA